MNRTPKIAIVHEWLTSYGGSEQVLEALLEVWPEAPIFALVADPHGQCTRIIENHCVHQSFISRLPRARKWYRYYLALMPIAVEQHDLRGYDIVISNSHAVAKGVITGPDQLHIAHVCSPLRYAWDLQFQYLQDAGLARGLKSLLARLVLHYVRAWDFRTSPGVDHFIAISSFVARRIQKAYRREATVIYPPVDVSGFTLCGEKEDFYLTSSRMVPYKKVDVIVEAFSQMPGKRLVVIGTGPDFEKVRRKAGSNVQLMGYQSTDVLREHMQKAKAFVFSAEEDFGIVAVEAQACGTPVIAYRKGGALETVIDGKTGLFFEEQTVQGIMDAVERFEQARGLYDAKSIRTNTQRFSKERFKTEIREFVEEKWAAFSDHAPAKADVD